MRKPVLSCVGGWMGGRRYYARGVEEWEWCVGRVMERVAPKHIWDMNC
jgi:hypothetical protein